MDGGMAMPRPPMVTNFSMPPPNAMQPPPYGGPRPPYQSQYNNQSNQSQPGKRFMGPDVMFDGKRMRKAVYRKTVDYNTSVVNYLENRIWQRDMRDQRGLQPDLLYCPLVVPPPDLISKPMNCVTTRFIRTSMNKIKCPIFCVCWTPEGRRLITGASSGEFTLWNGLTFNFETILQAHDSSVRAMQWSPNDQWMLTGDHNGFVKYWQSNMNNVKMYQAHKDPIRGLRCVMILPSVPPPSCHANGASAPPGEMVRSLSMPSSGYRCLTSNLTIIISDNSLTKSTNTLKDYLTINISYNFSKTLKDYFFSNLHFDISASYIRALIVSTFWSLMTYFMRFHLYVLIKTILRVRFTILKFQMNYYIYYIIARLAGQIACDASFFDILDDLVIPVNVSILFKNYNSLYSKDMCHMINII